MNINRKAVFEGLLTLFELGGKNLREDLKRIGAEIGAVPILSSKAESWTSDPGKFEMAAAAIQIIGYAGGKETVKPLAHHLRHVDQGIKAAAIRALQNIGSPSCLEFVFPTLKLASEPVVLLMLELIGSFKNPDTILPLLHIMGRSEETIKARILEILTAFPPDELESVIENKLDQGDAGLRRNALRLFEAIGLVEASRRLRERFKNEVEIKPVVKQDTSQLQTKVKTSGDMAMLSLNGILDKYTLPKLSKTLKLLFTQGYLKIFLVCNQLEKVDGQSLRSVNKLAAKLEPFGGLLMVISMTAIAEEKRSRLLGNVEYYRTIKEAVLSFSPARLEEAVPLASEMLQPGAQIELIVQSGLHTVTRLVTVRSFDGDVLELNWFPRSAREVFKEDLSSDVKIALLDRNRIVTFESMVLQQEFAPEPFITLSRPRKGRVVDYRRHVRVPTHTAVVYYHILSNKQIKKDLKGTCRNLSVGGMLLETQEMLPEGDVIVSVFAEHPLLEGQKAPGRVVNSKKAMVDGKPCFEYGISFLQIQDMLKDRIAQVVYDDISRRFES